MSDNTEQFTISVVGDVSGEKFFGIFKAKKCLTHRDRLNQDRVRRELLGTLNPDGASVGAHSIAEAISQITVRLTDSPPWWQGSSNGIDLVDGNVITEIYTSVIKIENDQIEAVKKAAQEAEKTLKEKAAEIAK